MAIKGAQSKEFVAKQIIDTFEGSFKYEKEIRIPCYEDGQEIQIKVTLTAAKENVEPNGDIALPGAKTESISEQAPPQSYVPPLNSDKETVARLLDKLIW